MVTVNVDEASVGLKKHFRVEKLLLFSGLVDVRALLSKQFLFVNIGAKVLNELRLDFLVLDIERITDIIELPPFLDFKVFSELLPVVVDVFDQFEVGLDDSGHFAQIDRVLLHVLPEHQIPFQKLSYLPLDLLELYLRVDDVLDVQLTQVQLIVQFLVLLLHRLLYPLQLQFLERCQILCFQIVYQMVYFEHVL